MVTAVARAGQKGLLVVVAGAQPDVAAIGILQERMHVADPARGKLVQHAPALPVVVAAVHAHGHAPVVAEVFAEQDAAGAKLNETVVENAAADAVAPEPQPEDPAKAPLIAGAAPQPASRADDQGA
jgi:hypothetical protein